MKTNCKDIFDIVRSTKSDAALASLCDRTFEYARMYYFVKKRQKGCDGLGEVTNLRDDLRVIIEELIAYCREKEYLDPTASYDVEQLIEEAANI